MCRITSAGSFFSWLEWLGFLHIILCHNYEKHYLGYVVLVLFSRLKNIIYMKWKVLRFVFFLFLNILISVYFHCVFYCISQELLNLSGSRNSTYGFALSREILYILVCFLVHWVNMLRIWYSSLAQCKSLMASYLCWYDKISYFFSSIIQRWLVVIEHNCSKNDEIFICRHFETIHICDMDVTFFSLRFLEIFRRISYKLFCHVDNIV